MSDNMTLRESLRTAIQDKDFKAADDLLERIKRKKFADAEAAATVDGVNMGAQPLGVVDNQDMWQKIFANMGFVLEIYKVIMACMLVVFSDLDCPTYWTNNSTTTSTWIYGSYESTWVSDPRFESQLENHYLCTEEESWDFFINSRYTLPMVTLALNIGSAALFFILYCIEYRREMKMIDWLDVNKSLPNEDEACAEAFKELDDEKRQELHLLNLAYRVLGMVCILAYAANAIMSTIMLSWYAYPHDNSWTTFFVQISLVLNKLNAITKTSLAPPNTYYAAYQKTRIQFNDIDRTDESEFD